MNAMKSIRSVLAMLVVAIAIFVVGCSGPTVAKGPLYSAEQLAQIEQTTADVMVLRERVLEIPGLVRKGDWNDVRTFIHGPLGELRFKMSTLSRQLRPVKAQKEALTAAREVFEHLNAIDEATQTADPNKAFANYNEVIRDFDAFLDLIPTNAG